jgi:hypothetical protein
MRLIEAWERGDFNPCEAGMKITDVQEETEDLDWFAVDRSGAVAHIATGGMGFLPDTVKESFEDLNRLKNFFRSLADNRCQAVVSDRLTSRLPPNIAIESVVTFSDFRSMASRGLYSFDCVLSGRRPTGYFLVAFPTEPLKADALPTAIQTLLRRTACHRSFSECVDIAMADFSMQT